MVARSALKQIQGNAAMRESLFRKSKEVINLKTAVLCIVADLVEFRDGVTGGHIYRTRKFLQFLLEALIDSRVYEDEVSTWDMGFMIPSAQLHDIGKVGISDAILNKPGRLTANEYEQMKKHVLIGIDIIGRIEKTTGENAFLRHARNVVGAHHEKWDGTGYPFGLRGEAIPLEGRLMAVADVYDALTSQRPYKASLSTAEAEKFIDEGRGTHFDPRLVDVFHKVSHRFADIVMKTGRA
ncbi:MAG: HD domain-containing protein [Candidatus Accumulibacter sp.]|nr:HD domain-containing protein [Accumulibacter sp.]